MAASGSFYLQPAPIINCLRSSKRLGGSATFADLPLGIHIGEIGIVLVTTITAVVLSFIAFQRVLRADREAQKLYPALGSRPRGLAAFILLQPR